VLTTTCVAATLLVFFGHSVQLARAQQLSRRYRRESNVIRNMRSVAEVAGPNAVVLANPLLSWSLPTFGPKVISLLHEDPLVPDGVRRGVDVRRFLSPRVSDRERTEILARYHVSHVLLDRERGPTVRFLDKVSTVRTVSGGYRLYTLLPGVASAP